MSCQKKWMTDYCTNSGKLVSIEFSMMFFANRFSTLTTDDPRIRELICATTGLDTIYVEMVQNEPIIIWMSFGTYNGIYRLFPANYTSHTYDPRYRPWYVSAAYGQKCYFFN
jgi:hypothetical protein